MPNELVGLYVEENPRSCLRAGDADKGARTRHRRLSSPHSYQYWRIVKRESAKISVKLEVRRFAQTPSPSRRAEGQDARKIHCFGIVMAIGTIIGAVSNP